MRRVLFHLFGPLAIQSYGVFIAFGILIFYLLIQRNPRYTQMKLHAIFVDILFWGVLVAIVGGRALYLLTTQDRLDSYLDIFALWNGGFSVLGSISLLIVFLPWYLKVHTIPIFPFMDLLAIYAPLLQSIARIGCFFAGCCYGIHSTVPWAFTYTDPLTHAPLNIPLHPTQLYSSVLLAIIFLIQYFIIQRIQRTAGTLFASYLILISIERFCLDFLRADRDMITHSLWSVNQLLAGVLILIGCSILAYVYSTKKYFPAS